MRLNEISTTLTLYVPIHDLKKKWDQVLINMQYFKVGKENEW